MRILMLCSLMLVVSVGGTFASSSGIGSKGSMGAMGSIDQLYKDFKPITGTIIAQKDDTSYLIDIVSEQGLKVGDLLLVSQQGEMIVHPRTGEELGYQRNELGFVRVTSVGSRYSEVKTSAPDLKFSSGDSVASFTSVFATFVSKVPNGFNYYRQISERLPSLAWQPFVDKSSGAEVPAIERGLVFEYDGRVIRVTGSQGSPVYGEYPVAVSSAQATKQNNSMPTEFWKSATRKGLGVTIASLPVDEENVLFVAYEREIVGYRWDGSALVESMSYRAPRGMKLLHLTVFDVDGDSVDELLVTGVIDSGAVSMVMSCRDDQLKKHSPDVKYMLRVLKVTDGTKQLLGQKAGERSNGFEPKIYRMAWSDGSVQVTGAPLSDMNFNLYGWTQMVQNETEMSIGINPNYQIEVYQGAKLTWRGDDNYGGTLKWFEIKDRDLLMSDKYKLRKYIASRVEVIDDDNVVFVQNEGSRVLRNSLNFKRSSVVALRWNGLSFEEVWRTPKVEAYLADFFVDDVDGDGNDDLIVLNGNKGGIFSKAKSQLTLYHLPQ